VKGNNGMVENVDKVGRDKRESFKRLSKSRLEQGKQLFKVFGNLGNPYNYSFTKEDLNHITAFFDAEVAKLRATYAKAMIDPAEANVGEKKGRPKKVRIPDSESTTTGHVAKEIAEEAKTAIAKGPGLVITTRPAPPTVKMSDEDVPDFLRKKAV
jgi:hypothetical protein